MAFPMYQARGGAHPPAPAGRKIHSAGSTTQFLSTGAVGTGQ